MKLTVSGRSATKQTGSPAGAECDHPGSRSAAAGASGPAGGGHVPAGGGHVPAGGGHVPAGGGHVPAGGGHVPAGGTSADERWLATTWPFVRDQLPPPPARVIELGCGPLGGHVPALLRAGYDAVGVDPEAPDGSEGSVYRRAAFEDCRPDGPVDAVIASVSLHHVDDLGAVLGHVADVLRADGTVVVVEWVSEEFDEATAQWCFRHQFRDPAEPGTWLAGLHAEWVASGLSWSTYFRGWLDHHGLHAAAVIRRELEARFVTTHLGTGPYYYPDLVDTDAAAEQAAIDAGRISAGCLRYAGRRARRAAADAGSPADPRGSS